MSWWGVTQTAVLDATALRVSDADIAMASSMVEIFVNRTEAASAAMANRDTHWVRQAIIWQAAWLPSQADVAGRLDATRVDQDGVATETGTTSSGSARPHAFVLAPMAARAIKNLSWKASRAVEMPNLDVLPAPLMWDATLESNDCLEDWNEL